MMITITEGRVTPDKWVDLEKAFRTEIKHAPHQLKETFLLHDRKNTRTWRIVSVWRSVEDYEEAVKGGHTETCTRIFRTVDVEPTKRVFDVPAKHEHI